MPYISENMRSHIDSQIRDLVIQLKAVDEWSLPGVLNYTITKVTKSLWKEWPRYITINTIVGALECAKHEFLRRDADPHEDVKREENGDVTPC